MLGMCMQDLLGPVLFEKNESFVRAGHRAERRHADTHAIAIRGKPGAPGAPARCAGDGGTTGIRLAAGLAGSVPADPLRRSGRGQPGMNRRAA